MHYAGETYGDYDSQRETENTDRVFEWPNEEENSAENRDEIDNENEYRTDSETEYETDSEVDSIPALIGDTDTESDDEGYETDATVIADNDDSDVSDSETDTDCDSMPELLTPSDTDTSDDEEECDNNRRCVLQRPTQRIARTVRV